MAQRARLPPGAELFKVAILKKTRNTTENKHTTFARVLSSHQTIVRLNVVLHICDLKASTAQGF